MSIDFDKLSNEVVSELEDSLTNMHPTSADQFNIELLKKAILEISCKAHSKMLEKYHNELKA